MRNRAGCLDCGDVIESTHRHDFVSCSCGAIAVDGGPDYHRRLYKDRMPVELPTDESLREFMAKLREEQENAE